MSDHSLVADSEELTVEDENRRNSETDDVHSVLDTFMTAKEETLEELVGGFMYLTMEDVRKAASNAVPVLVPNAVTDDVFREGEDVKTVSMPSVLTAPPHSPAEAERGGGRGDSGGEQTEDIEEEVLEDGDTNSRRSCEDALFRHRPASLTKFDNFVLSEEDDPGIDSERDGNRDGDVEEEDGKEGEEGEDWMPSSGYMASFAAAGNSAAAENVVQSAQTCINQSHTAHQTSQDINGTSPQRLSTSGVTLDTKEPSPSDTQTEDSMIIPEPADMCPDSHSSVCEEEVEGPAWALNPGEAEEEEVSSVPLMTRVSVIDISTKLAASVGVGDAGENAVSGEAENDCSDDVVPFELDENYDYDNVVLTPKFTQAEMNYLTSFLPQNS